MNYGHKRSVSFPRVNFIITVYSYDSHFYIWTIKCKFEGVYLEVGLTVASIIQVLRENYS